MYDTHTRDSTEIDHETLPANTKRSPLLALREHLISQIASYLPLDEIITFLTSHRDLLQIFKTTSTPLPSAIHQILLSPHPYPTILSYLPLLSLYLPDSPSDSSRIFLELLVRARPKWILKTLQYGKWGDSIWKEAFERRFLPSWGRYREGEGSWRGAFLEVLWRLELRGSGSSHLDRWTRFVTLHRNGSASINRLYSALFDPYEIYDELKHQNNFSALPTQVRVVVHLQDVRIIVLGALSSHPSLFVNPNAHLLLHPPLLRKDDIYRDINPPSKPLHSESGNGAHHSKNIGSSTTTNEAYFPLVRSLSTSGPNATSYGLTEGPITGASASPPSPSFRSAFTKIMRRSSHEPADDPTSLPALLTRARSREAVEEQRKRTWSFGRNRAGSSSGSGSGSGSVSNSALGAGGSGGMSLGEGSNIIAGYGTGHGGVMPPLVESGNSPVQPLRPIVDLPYTPPRSPPTTRPVLPYAPLMKPVPAFSHQLYPNHTPRRELETEGEGGSVTASRHDSRAVWQEVEDEVEGYWTAGEGAWGDDGLRMAEWDARNGKRRWVGPMIVIAQLHPSDRDFSHPQGVNTATPIEGSADEVDLGPKGMYCSLDFEDLKVIMPWIEMRGGGGNSSEAMRGGMGF